MTLVTTLDNDTPDAEALGVSSFVAKIDGSNRLEINMVKPVEIDGFNLHMLNRICYTMGGRMIGQHHITHTKSPPRRHLGGLFYSHIASRA